MTHIITIATEPSTGADLARCDSSAVGQGEPRPINPQPPQIPAMTLRDWFAGQALAGMAPEKHTTEIIAGACYQLADAMMKEREAKDG